MVFAWIFAQGTGRRFFTAPTKNVLVFSARLLRCIAMKPLPNLRRLASGICLGVSLLMLVPGLTFLSHRLSGTALALYWLVCFLLTGLAAIIALVDIMLLRRALREQQRNLIKTTFDEVGPDLSNRENIRAEE